MRKISVIINNYNYSSYIEECILSVAGQEYGNMEIICVDDGSTDNSMDIIQRYKDKLMVIQKKNGGQASAFNAGFAESTGDLIIFLDSDDFLMPGAINQICELVPSDFEGVVQFLMNTVNAQGLYINKLNKLHRNDMESSDILRIFGPGNIKFPPTSGNVWTRKALCSVMPIPESKFRISADAFLFSTIPAMFDVLPIEYTISSYRIHGKNLYKSPFEYRKTINNMEIYLARCTILAEMIDYEEVPLKWLISTPYYLGLLVSEKKFNSIVLAIEVIKSRDIVSVGKILRIAIIILVTFSWTRSAILSSLHKRYV